MPQELGSWLLPGNTKRVKVEESPQVCGPGEAALGEVKADPESLQPAQDTAQAVAGSKPAVATRSIPGRAAAAAGITKRIQSEAKDAPAMPPAKRSRATSASRASKGQKKAARQPSQPSSKAALGEVKSDPESLQPAQITAQVVVSSKPAAAPRCIPGRAGEGAGIAKQARPGARSKAEDAPAKPPAKRSRATSASHTLKAQKRAAKRPKQPSSKAALGEADPDCLQPAQDTAQAVASSKPAAPRCLSSRAAAAAGIARRNQSEAEDATAMPPAKRSRATSASHTLEAQKRAAKRPKQPSSKAALGEVKAIPDSLQPAQDTAQAVASSKPAVATRCIPGRAAAAAGNAKRIASEAEDNPAALPAKRPKTTSASHTLKAQKKGARHPRQRSTKTYEEADGTICIDVEPHAASGHRGRQAQKARQEAQAMQAFSPAPEIPQAGRFGNLVTDTPQYLIIGGENPSQWAKGCVPQVSRR